MAEMQKKPQQVYTLLVQVGRTKSDGLPKGCIGAALMCYSTGIDEAEAVRETVAVIKKAELNPLDVTGYGTIAEREAEGAVIEDEEKDLMWRALQENSVIVAQMTPLYDNGKRANDRRFS